MNHSAIYLLVFVRGRRGYSKILQGLVGGENCFSIDVDKIIVDKKNFATNYRKLYEISTFV